MAAQINVKKTSGKTIEVTTSMYERNMLKGRILFEVTYYVYEIRCHMSYDLSHKSCIVSGQYIG